MSKLYGLIKSQDIYGHGIGIQYRGQDSHKTGLGALLTIFSYVLVSVYLAARVQEFFDNSSQIEQVNKKSVDLFDEPVINLNESHFSLIAGSNYPIPKGIGEWKTKSLTWP